MQGLGFSIWDLGVQGLSIYRTLELHACAFEGLGNSELTFGP